MRRSIVCAVCFGAILANGCVAEASDSNSVEKQLRQELEHKILSLKAPNASKVLRFDSSGQPTGEFLPAPWTTAGLLQAEKISLTPNELRIDCQRVLVALRRDRSSSKSPILLPIVTNRSV